MFARPTVRGVLAALVAVSALTLLPASAGARPPIRALAYRGASSPVLHQLRAQLGHKLRIARATRARLRHRARYKLLILDGDALSPAQLAKRRHAIDRYMDRGGWVLALDVRSGHFTTLDKLTHFSATPSGAPRASKAFLFRDADVHGMPTVVMVDAPADGSSAARSAAYLIRTRLIHPNTGLRRPRYGADEIPPYLRHREWQLTVAARAPIRAAYWHPGMEDPLKGVLGVPEQGHQTADWSMRHTFDVYLDDRASDAGAPYQIVTYNLHGEFNPKQPDDDWAQMEKPFTCQGAGSCQMYIERAWWTGRANVRVTPDAATSDKLTIQATAPATPNETTTYQSGDDFSVGFSVSPSEGPGAETSYQVKNVTTHTIPDWGVENLSAANELAWQFSARNACDVRPAAFDWYQCFGSKGSQEWPVKPNELSRSQLVIDASGRWRTKQLLTDTASGTLSFALSDPVELEDTWCDEYLLNACVDNFLLGRHLNHDALTTGPPTTTYSIDASAVAPVPMKSLDVSPNPVDGTANETATGTITLADKAKIDTNVVVFSDNRHARVGTPTGSDVSKLVVPIHAGDDRATFEIHTNDNYMKPGSSATAEITAFDGTAKTVPLKVTSEKN